MLVLIALLILGGIGYGIFLVGHRVWVQRLAKSAIPGYLAELRSQRDRLLGAIERYHAHFGYYPPNRSTNLAERAIMNPLYYELVGTQWNSDFQAYRIPTAKATIEPETMERFFAMKSFSNSLSHPFWPTNFIEGLALVGREENDVALMSYNAPEDISSEVDAEFTVSAWRYAADPALRNPGKFDLWIEVEVLGRRFVINNWDPPPPTDQARVTPQP
jgi:hypothetical protein